MDLQAQNHPEMKTCHRLSSKLIRQIRDKINILKLIQHLALEKSQFLMLTLTRLFQMMTISTLNRNMEVQ